MYDPATMTVPEVHAGEHDANPPHFAQTQKEKPDFSGYDEPGGDIIHGFQSHRRDREKLAKDIAIYYGMISCMDKYIGRILDHLEANNLLQNTLVVFTSDHGHFFGQHGLIAKGPFHYEDLVRVPMIAAWPGHIPAHADSDGLQSLVDYAPTFLQAAGVQPPASMAGTGRLANWEGRAPARDHVLVENRHQPTTVCLNTLVTERYKLTTYAGHAYGELFDLREDPDEVHNRWDDPDYASVKTHLLIELCGELALKDPVPMPRVSPA